MPCMLPIERLGNELARILSILSSMFVYRFPIHYYLAEDDSFSACSNVVEVNCERQNEGQR